MLCGFFVCAGTTLRLGMSASRLDTHQRAALRAALNGTNVAVVGPGGSGKSEVLKHAVRCGQRRWGNAAVVVLAWRGSAAHLLRGMTLSSILRVTVGDPSKERILLRLCHPRNASLWRELLAVRMVVIDEGPTIAGRWLDRLEYVFRMAAPVLQQGRPFGGRVVFGPYPLALSRRGLFRRLFSLMFITWRSPFCLDPYT